MRESMAKLFTLFVVVLLAQVTLSARPTRWCVTTADEEIKCNELKSILQDILDNSMDPLLPIPEQFECIRTFDAFMCMSMIEGDEADLISLDSGQGYFAGRQHNMMPIMAEDYRLKDENGKPFYYAVALMKTSDPVTILNLINTKVCFPGIGTSAGWVNPIGQLLKQGMISVTECNAIVKAVSNSFESMCLPGAVNSFYNPFGNNPTTVCALCTGQNNEFCSTSDRHAGFDGAYRCVVEGNGQLAFIRHDTIEQMTGTFNGSGTGDLRLLCPDGAIMTTDQYESCNWGEISSNVIMTSAVRDPDTVQSYKDFLKFLAERFGPSSNEKFKIFESKTKYDTDIYNLNLFRKNLMFSDMAIGFYDLGSTSYFQWAGTTFHDYLTIMNNCPSQTVRWCVTSMAEKLKCEDMIMAFKAKSLKPEMDCMYGGNTSMCMEMIYRGDADLINLDAGDVYIAGRRYGLIPVAAEDYGDMSMMFKVVAAARKTDKSTTLFNMKGRRACQPGIGRGDGWIVPLNIYIETEQFLPEDCTIFKNIGELFVRSCIPGALDSEYNPIGTPINLCEGCAAGGYRKCQRNAEEQYYGASGSFRCLVEKGGDVAFVRHLTVRDNTDGRNHAIWARNRRSDDYELMCKDGRRLNIDKFAECHLGEVPSNAIVMSPHKNPMEKEIIWNLLNYGQQFFSSDTDGDFHMFDSGLWYTDLIFTDAAVRLMKIPEERQNYKDWLGESFIAQIENLQKYTCVNPDSASMLSPSMLLLTCVAILCSLWARL